MNNACRRVAHRGGSLLAPENTLAAFRHALTLPIDGIEFDVQISRDGVAIVFHDNTIDRLTDGKGNILDLDWPSLRTLNVATHFAGGWSQPEYISTLEEVLTFLKGRTEIYIELKASHYNGRYGRYPHIAETTVNTLQKLDMLDQVLIISFDWQLLGEVKALEPTLPTGGIVAREWWYTHLHPMETVCEQFKALGCSWINMDYRLCSPEVIAYMHKYGLKVGVWTVNTLEELQSLAVAGVDSLTTDRPDYFTHL